MPTVLSCCSVGLGPNGPHIDRKLIKVTQTNVCESYQLSDDSQLKELWRVVDDCESGNGQNVHPCCPSMRHLEIMLIL